MRKQTSRLESEGNALDCDSSASWQAWLVEWLIVDLSDYEAICLDFEGTDQPECLDEKEIIPPC